MCTREEDLRLWWSLRGRQQLTCLLSGVGRGCAAREQ
jgi:hypothetical protein